MSCEIFHNLAHLESPHPQGQVEHPAEGKLIAVLLVDGYGKPRYAFQLITPETDEYTSMPPSTIGTWAATEDEMLALIEQAPVLCSLMWKLCRDMIAAYEHALADGRIDQFEAMVSDWDKFINLLPDEPPLEHVPKGGAMEAQVAVGVFK